MTLEEHIEDAILYYQGWADEEITDDWDDGASYMAHRAVSTLEGIKERLNDD